MEILRDTVKRLSEYIERNTTVAGNITFDMGEACELRHIVETLDEEARELEKIQNHTNASEVHGEARGSEVNHPLHYLSPKVNGKVLECIDVMEAVKGWFPTALFCELNAFKYNWRLGNKDVAPQELGKIKWYGDKAMKLWKDNLQWIHHRNGKAYAIIEELKLKDPTTGTWSEAVLYTDGKGKYVRDKMDFINKFKQL